MDACFDIENSNIKKMKIKIVREKKVSTEEVDGEQIITFYQLTEAMESLTINKEFTDNNQNVIQLAEACCYITNILIKM